MICRNEFRAWTDIKPVKPIKAKPQYKPPDDKMAHETSYSSQFKGEANKPTPADNKFIDRRRIRSLYSEPFKEPPKVRLNFWGPISTVRHGGVNCSRDWGAGKGVLPTLAPPPRASLKPLLSFTAHRDRGASYQGPLLNSK